MRAIESIKQSQRFNQLIKTKNKFVPRQISQDQVVFKKVPLEWSERSSNWIKLNKERVVLPELCEVCLDTPAGKNWYRSNYETGILFRILEERLKAWTWAEMVVST